MEILNHKLKVSSVFPSDMITNNEILKIIEICGNSLAIKPINTALGKINKYNETKAIVALQLHIAITGVVYY